MTSHKRVHWADKLGVISAFLCIIHCLAVPALLTMGIGFINNPIIASLFVVIAFLSIYKTTNKKIFSPISIFLWVAFIGFVTSIYFEESAAIFEYTMYASSLLIIAGHIYNMKYCSK